MTASFVSAWGDRKIAGNVQVASNVRRIPAFEFSFSISHQFLSGRDRRHDEHGAASMQAEQ
jgi:hypothetical protein